MFNRESPGKNKYRAAIIGAGRIGAGRIGAKFDTRKNRKVLTHAYGYTNHEATRLVGFYDTDVGRSEAAAKQWSSKSFSSLKMLMEEGRPDIVSICTPDEDHVSTLERILPYQPRIIICEKPVTLKSQDTKRIIRLARKKNVPILVNYSRRFDSSVEELQKSMRAGLYGKVLAAVGIYMRGALHNGSHVVDLARYLFGEVKKIIPLYARNDFSASDKSAAAFLQLEHCPQFHLVVGDGRCYFILEFDILFEKARWRFTDKGFSKSVQRIEKDSHFPTFIKSLKSAPDEPTHLREAITRMVDNAVAYLEGRERLLCDIEEALKTQKVCEKLWSVV